MKKNIFWGIVVTILLIMIDQITKHIAVLYLKTGNDVELIFNVFKLHYLENRGAAFGVFQGGIFIFVPMTIILLFIFSYLYIRLPLEKKFNYLRIILILFAAGAVGNLIDRILNNYVVDFFYFYLIDFPIFNIADIYVTIACAFFALLIIFYYKDDDFKDIEIFPKNKNKG